jgi:predicted RNase H-like nuclease (RuvC/YqgF family)
MKVDIVERLQENQLWLHRDGFRTSADNARDAKEEIESLRKQVQEQAAEIRQLQRTLEIENSIRGHTDAAVKIEELTKHNGILGREVKDLERQLDEAMQDAERYRKLFNITRFGCYQLRYWDTNRGSWYNADVETVTNDEARSKS